MNAQVKQEETVKHVPLTEETLKAAVGGIVEAIKHRSDDAKSAAEDGRKAVEKVRALARDVVADGLNVAAVSTMLAQRMKLAGIPKGTINPYQGAFTGYCAAVASDVDIESYKTDARGKAKPMTAPEAREFLTRVNETDEQREVREADERIKALRRAAIQRLNKMDEASLRDLLASGVLPEIDEEEENETRGEKAAESRMERERREAEEAEEAAEKALHEAFTVTAEQVQEAAEA